MKKALPVVVLVFALALSVPAAERTVLTQAERDVTVTVLDSRADRTVLRFDINAFNRTIVDIGGQTFVLPSCEREGVLHQAGEPALPRICRSILIPDNAEMQIEVLDFDYVDYANTLVAPSKGNLPRTVNPEDVPYAFGPVYQTDTWYPGALAELREPYILRDLRGTVVELNAFQYQPVQHVLRVYTSMTVEISSAGPGRANVLARAVPLTRVDPMFDTVYRRHFVNYGMSGALDYTPVLEDGEMLIITYDSFRSYMQPFMNWKVQKGIKTTMVNVSTIGNNMSAISEYIDNFYTSSGGNLAYVLLVGDAAQVATPTASGGSSDPSYAKIVGGDDYPDIFVGRFSAQSTSDVATQVERSIEYERDAQAGADWYHLGTGVASDQGPGHNGEYDYQHMNYIRTDLLGFTYTAVDQIYDPGATAAMVSAALNAGRSIVNYTGHGDATSWGTTDFSNTHVNALTNDNMLPFIYSVACLNGQFASTTCFGEAWLRAQRDGQPIGALATYMSSINQSWDPPMDAQDEATDLLCAQSKTTFGGLCFNSACRMIDINGAGGVEIYDTWHIFGDPSVQVRTATPVAMSVSHAGEIPFGTPSFDVTVSGVVGALCALAKDSVLFGAAYTNGSGYAAIPVSGTLPIGQTVTLTVTAFNKLTYVANLMVTSGGPDVWPPNISFTPLPDTDNSVGPYVLNATITDYSGIQDAVFRYGFDGTHFSSLPMARDGGNAWSVSFGGYPEGTVVHYYVIATDSSENHNADTSDVHSFGVLGVLYSYDTESGESGWTHSALATGKADQWHVSTEMYHSAGHAWKFGDTGTGTYANTAYGGLVSPSIHLREMASVSFWHWMQAESSTTYPDSAYDAGVVDISVDGGVWEQILTLSPDYNKYSRCQTSVPFTCRTHCYSGNIGWTQVSASLAAYADHDVQLRFRFGSDGNVAREGWYVDDVVVMGLPELQSLTPVSDLITEVVNDSIRLAWSPTGAPWYHVYSAVEIDGPFETLVTSVSDTTVTLPVNNNREFFMVVSSSGF